MTVELFVRGETEEEKGRHGASSSTLFTIDHVTSHTLISSLVTVSTGVTKQFTFTKVDKVGHVFKQNSTNSLTRPQHMASYALPMHLDPIQSI